MQDRSFGAIIFQAAARAAKTIPSLCYALRLDVFGGCRLRIARVKGLTHDRTTHT